MSMTHPTLVSAENGLAATSPDQGADSWWFAARLLDEGEKPLACVP
ncbi:hypothetical protein [Streptomyces sp. NPDC046862]